MKRTGILLPEVQSVISIHDLDAKRMRQVPLRLVSYFRERKPDVTLVHMWPLTSIAVMAWRLAGSPGKLFLCEHVGLTDHVRRDLSTPLRVVKAILWLSHRNASGLVAVSHGAAADLAHILHLPPHAIRVIHNPVVSPEISPRHTPDFNCRNRLWHGAYSRTLLSIGTLKPQKNFLLLLDAFATLADDLDAGLVILGEGPQRSALHQRIDQLGLNRRVHMPGFDANPDKWLRSSDLFILSSDFEGFGNVVAEALSAGTPVVSTACRHGPSEILDYGRYGILVPVGDCMSLANGIRAALSRTWDHSVLQRRALDFSIPSQSSAYLDLFGFVKPSTLNYSQSPFRP